MTRAHASLLVVLVAGIYVVFGFSVLSRIKKFIQLLWKTGE